MSSSGTFCLKLDNLADTLCSTFSQLRTDHDLLDVTLGCEDGTQLEAHKLVLLSGSKFSTEILKAKKKETPIIYMRGLKNSELSER